MLDIAVLGPLLLHLDGRPLELSSMRQRALLATLALNARRTVPKAVLARSVWGDNPPNYVSSSLYTLVNRLRVTIGDDLVRTEAGGYRLDVPPDCVDALRFRQRLDASLAADGETAHRIVIEALALWRGTPLADVGSASVEDAYAVALTEQYLGAMERRADLELRLPGGPSAELIAELRRLTAAHPLRESVWQRLLAALGAAGRLAEALESYETVRKLLDDELGTPPSADLRATHAELLREDPRALAAASAKAQTRAHPPTPPMPCTTATAPQLLPTDTDGFIGRADELATLDELPGSAGTGSGRAAIAVVHGIGGVGKTALAVHWAHTAGRHFPDGRLYIDLRGYGPDTPVTAHHALGLLLTQLGIDADRMPAHADERRLLWQTALAGRRALVVLDNARSVQQVRPLLPGLGGTAVVTSRSRLSGLTIRDGARSVPLAELTDAQAAHVLATAVGAARTTAEPEAVSRLARACGRLPLALRIVAESVSRHPSATLSGFAAEFDRVGSPGGGSDSRSVSLDVLAVSDDPVSDVRTVFSWSYEQLDADTARLFRLLSLVPGGAADAEAATALAGRATAEVRTCLAALAGLHLLEEDSPGRYHAHDLLREYAAERAAAEDSAADRAAALDRLVTWYLHAVDGAVDILCPRWNRLAPPDGTPAAPLPRFEGDAARAHAWLDEQCGGLVAAVEHTARAGPYPYAWLLADRLRGYFWRSLRVAEWQATADAALTAAAAHGDAGARAVAALTAADLHTHTSRPDDAVLQYRQAGRLAQEAGRPDLAATALNNLAGTLWRFGRLTQSAACLSEVLELNRRLGRAHGQFSAHLNLASVCLRIGRTHDAHEHLLESLTLAADRQERARVMINLVKVSHAMGRLDEALGYARQALPTVRESNDTTWQADCHCYLAAIHSDRGEQDRAQAEARAAQRTAEATHDPLVEAEALVTGGAVLLRFAAPDDAGPLYLRALGIARDNGLLHVEVSSRTGLAAIAAGAGQPDEAAAHATTAVALAQEHGFTDHLGEALLALGQVRLRQRDLAAAEEVADRAAQVDEAAGRRIGRARALLLRGRVLAAGGDPRAAAVQAEALAQLTELACPEPAQAAAPPSAIGDPFCCGRTTPQDS